MVGVEGSSVKCTLNLAFAAAAVAVFAGAALACGPAAVAPSSAAVASSPVVPASPAATPSPNLLDTSTWTTYVSERYGFSIAHPADWTEEPADHDWTLASDADWQNTAADNFVLEVENQGIRVSAWSVAVDSGTSVDSWLQAYCPNNTGPCTEIQDRAVAATMDGHAGSLVQFDGDVQAFFLVDGRIYAIACWQAEEAPSMIKYSGSRRLVEAFLSTMRLLPGGPAPSATTSSPS
jgi:hypothetical protein